MTAPRRFIPVGELRERYDAWLAATRDDCRDQVQLARRAVIVASNMVDLWTKTVDGATLNPVRRAELEAVIFGYLVSAHPGDPIFHLEPPR